jgi:hypothetical protein
VFTAWYALSPYIKQISFVFKGLIVHVIPLKPSGNCTSDLIRDHVFTVRSICYIRVCFLGHTMAQAVSCQPLTAEAGVRVRTSPCEICGKKSGYGAGFCPTTSVLLSVIPPLLHTHLHLNTAGIRRTRR